MQLKCFLKVELLIFLRLARGVVNKTKKLDPLRAKAIIIRKKMGHTAVSAIKSASVFL